MRKLVLLATIAALVAATIPALSRAASASGESRQAAAAQDARPTAVLAKRRRCDRNYRGRCLRPNVSDYDCAGGSGNGPYYVRGPFRVVGYDHYRLDSDGDGIACES
jgi:hypothetical protein